MGGDEDACSLFGQIAKGTYDHVCVVVIEGSGGFIGQDKYGLFYEQPSEGHSLLLATTEFVN